MTATLAPLPTFPRRKPLTGCAICHAEVPLSPRYGLCAVHAEQELYDLALRKHTRAHTRWEAQSVSEHLLAAYCVLIGMVALVVRREWIS